MRIIVEYYFNRSRWEDPQEFAAGLDERQQRASEYIRKACFTSKDYCKGSTVLLDDIGAIIAQVKIGV